MTTFVSLHEFTNSAGRVLEPSDWLLISQQRVNRFADATNDHQFIHIDPVKAADSPFHGTIAHGFLTLSLLSYLNAQTMIVPRNLSMVINYGSDRVRFLQPVRVGDSVRTQQRIVEVREKRPGEWLLKRVVKLETKSRARMAMRAEILSMYIVH